MKKDKLLLAGSILAGAAAGVLLGVLFAPDKGTDTRKKIVEKGEDYIDDLQNKLNSFVDDMNKKMNEMKSALSIHSCGCGPNCTCKGECHCADTQKTGNTSVL